MNLIRVLGHTIVTVGTVLNRNAVPRVAPSGSRGDRGPGSRRRTVAQR